MLVLGRKVGERVRIVSPDGWEGWITVVELFQGRKAVRIGFEFPREVVILREEVQDDSKEPRHAEGEAETEGI